MYGGNAAFCQIILTTFYYYYYYYYYLLVLYVQLRFTPRTPSERHKQLQHFRPIVI